MKKVLSAAAAALLFGASAIWSGCSSDLSAGVMPGVQLAEVHSIYVICSPQEDADICALLAADLAQRGVPATRGPADEVPANAAAVMTYEDRWMWDMLPYLLTLRVDLRDPKTNVLLATARSFRSSLVRKTPPTVVRQVVDALFEKDKA